MSEQKAYFGACECVAGAECPLKKLCSEPRGAGCFYLKEAVCKLAHLLALANLAGNRLGNWDYDTFRAYKRELLFLYSGDIAETLRLSESVDETLRNLPFAEAAISALLTISRDCECEFLENKTRLFAEHLQYKYELQLKPSENAPFFAKTHTKE